MTIFGREPLFWIGLISTLIFNAVATLLGVGLISDAQAGHVHDVVDALAKLALAFSPFLAVLAGRPFVTPTASPQLQAGTSVQVTDSTGQNIGRGVVTPK